MNINEDMDEIIFKYELDRYYPHYRNMYKAEKILRNVIRGIERSNKNVIIVGDDVDGIRFVRHVAGDYANIFFLLYDQNDIALHQLEDVAWEEYEGVYLISFCGVEYVEQWFGLHNIQYEWIYDIFEREGVYLQKEFYAFGKKNMLGLINPENECGLNEAYNGSVQCELYCQQNKYKNAGDHRTKRIALEKCFFLALYMRNFMAAKSYASLLMKEDTKYVHIWEEIQDLLDTIKRILSSRESKDIIMYWLDAISYGGESNMPYLKSVMDESVVFKNAFTYMPFTNPTLRALFLGKKEIDDKGYRITSITRENSPVLQFLEGQGYDIKVFSGVFNKSFSHRYQPSWFILNRLVPYSEILWNMLSEMLIHSRKTLWIVHTLDAHPPYLSSYMGGDNYRDHNIRHKLAKQEVDEQLAFYDEFIGRDAYRIYMSDHGLEPIYKVHTLFNVYHRTLEPRRIDGMFSFLDFGTVLQQLITDGNIEEKEFTKEYVEIGNLDWYNSGDIKALFQNKEVLNLKRFGYKGVVDKDYVYLHYKTGKEWLQKRTDTLLCDALLFYDFEGDVCEPDLLPKYRELVGEYPEDVIEDEKFKYTKYLYILYNNILKHNNMAERIDMINRMLQNYPAGSVAIRTGGVVAAMLYYVLSKENKEKIGGFIDSSDECLCSGLKLPIIRPNQIEDLRTAGIKAIVMPSFRLRDIFREESKKLSMHIDAIDIYDNLADNGIECREEFYMVRGTDEDYDVGFPFDEVKS